MKNKKNSELRNLAEKILQGQADEDPDSSKRSPDETHRLVQELQVHQIELELQNEELRKTQLELEMSRNKYSDLYDYAPVGFFTLNEKNIIIQANLTGAGMLGVDRSALTGKPFSNFITSDTQDVFYHHRRKLIETGTQQTCELSLKRNSTQFDACLESTSVIDDDKNCIQFQLAVMDITERKQAEIDLKQTEKKLRDSEKKCFAYLEHSPVCTKVVDLDFNLQYMSATGIKCLNTDDITPFYGQPYPFDFYPEPFRNLMTINLGKVKKTGKIIKQEGSVIDINGNELWTYSTLVPVKDDEDRIEYIIVVSIDITELKRAEEGKRKAEAQLRQAHKMESIGTLAGGVAHDFNNILYMIVGNTELALEDIPELHPAHTHLKEIQNASLRAADIIKQLLKFSCKTDPMLVAINVIAVIKDTLKFLRSMIPATIEICQHLPDTEVNIFADATQINQVLMNLFINASQEMADGGVLDVSVESVISGGETADIYNDLAPGEYVKIMIKDTGSGISPECIDRIFDPYFTTKAFGKSSGLGLSVVLGIVKNHNGTITVDSRPGKGSTFSIFIPATMEKPGVEIETPDEIPVGSEIILFVDDEKSIVKMTQRVLERLGYKVETKTDPEEALALFRSKPDQFDLVITDMTMPQMTGVKLFEKLKKIRSDIPVLICTGYSPQIDEETAREMGIAAYITKPAIKSGLAKKIREVLDKNQIRL